MKTKPLNFYQLVFRSILALILEKFFDARVSAEFPKCIGEYEFVKIFKKESFLVPFYSYAIYKNKSGKKAFAKMWSGKFNNYSYYCLLNEISVYKVLNSARKRSASSLPPKFRGISIPDFYASASTKNSLLILMEYVRANNAEDLSDKEKLAVYLKSVDYYHFLGNKLTKSERKLISRRSGFTYVLLYPLVFIKAFINYPKDWLTFVRTIPVFLSAIFDLLKNDQFVLTQRDLQFKNILYKNGKIILIDLEMCVMTHPLAEYANTLRSVAKNQKLFKPLMKELSARYANDRSFKRLLKGLITHITTHSLVEKQFKQGLISKDIECLRLIGKGTLIK